MIKDETLIVIVDYGTSIENAIELGCYDSLLNPHIISDNFPTFRKGKEKIQLRLIHFESFVSTEEILREINQINYRPAELLELIALDVQYRNLLWNFSIAALGSFWRDSHGNDRAPYLFGDVYGRGLRLRRIGRKWSKRWRFAVVR